MMDYIIPIKILKFDKLVLKHIWKFRDKKIAKQSWGKKSKLEYLHLPISKT